MRARTLLIFTAIISSILGAVVAYLVLTVPNDIQAGAILRDAQKQMAAGQNDRARQSLVQVVQQYPRTDAAASAIVGLSMLSDRERQQMTTRVEALERARTESQRQIAALTGQLKAAATLPPVTPPPVPAPVVESAPPPVAPAAAPKKKEQPKPVARKKRRRHH